MALLRFSDKEFGTVCVQYRRGTSRLSVKWSRGEVRLIAPFGVAPERIMQFFEQTRPWLRAHRPEGLFAHGKEIVLGGGYSFVVTAAQGREATVETRVSADRRTIIVNATPPLSLSSPEVEQAVSRLMLKCAPFFAEPLLIAPCRAEAARLGLHPRSIEISHGLRTLGTCSSTGHIRLSAACVFLTPELRRYIFCHELAHLTHHDHSTAFHRLLDTYLEGREATLYAALRAYRWPILR